MKIMFLSFLIVISVFLIKLVSMSRIHKKYKKDKLNYLSNLRNLQDCTDYMYNNECVPISSCPSKYRVTIFKKCLDPFLIRPTTVSFDNENDSTYVSIIKLGNEGFALKISNPDKTSIVKIKGDNTIGEMMREFTKMTSVNIFRDPSGFNYVSSTENSPHNPPYDLYFGDSKTTITKSSNQKRGFVFKLDNALKFNFSFAFPETPDMYSTKEFSINKSVLDYENSLIIIGKMDTTNTYGYLVKYYSNGAKQFSYQYTTQNTEFISVVIDFSNNIYVIGNKQDGTGKSIEIFILKFTKYGLLSQQKSIKPKNDPSKNIHGHNIDISGDNIAVVGYIDNDFVQIDSLYGSSKSGYQDGFIVIIDSNLVGKNIIQIVNTKGTSNASNEKMNPHLVKLYDTTVLIAGEYIKDNDTQFYYPFLSLYTLIGKNVFEEVVGNIGNKNKIVDILYNGFNIDVVGQGNTSMHGSANPAGNKAFFMSYRICHELNDNNACVNNCGAKMKNEYQMKCTNCAGGTHYVDSSDNCITCNSSQSYFNYKCLTNSNECPNIKHKIGNTCINCKYPDQYFNNGQCVKSCPNMFHIDMQYSVCLDCKPPFYFYENQCVEISRCPNINHITKNRVCKKCIAPYDKFFNDDCVLNEVLEEQSEECDVVLKYVIDYYPSYDPCQITCQNLQGLAVKNNFLECSTCTKLLLSSNCSIDCNKNVSVKYLGICVDECPASYFQSNGKCKKCPYDKPYVDVYVDKNNKNVEFCTETCNFGYEADAITKRCESCLLKIKVYYNGKCYDSCPDGTQYYESYGSCFGSQTEKNPIAELYSTVKPIKSSLFYDSTADTFNPRAFIGIQNFKNETNYCENGKSLLNSFCIECKSDYMKAEKNHCINDDKKCKYLSIGYRNETELLLNSTNKNASRLLNEMTPYMKCVNSCAYSIFNNTCLNCTDIGMKTTADGWECTNDCEYGYGPYFTNNQCKKCENIYFEGYCVDKCNSGYEEKIINGQRVCRLIVIDPYCNENSCKNSGICSIKHSGELKCNCSTTGFYGTFCDKTENELNNVYKRMNTYISLMFSSSKRVLEYQDKRNLQINLQQIKNDIESFPEMSLNYTDLLIEYAYNYLLSKLNNNKNTTMNELFNVVDIAFTSSKSSNKTSIDSINSIEGIKLSIQSVVESLILNTRNITEYLKEKKGIIYTSNNFAIHISDNTFQSKTEILKKKLPYIDFADCERKLRENGKISLDKKLYMVNIVYDSFLITDISKLQRAKSSSKSISSFLINSDMEKVSTEVCESFNFKFPINNNNVYIYTYEDTQNYLKYNIFNENDKVFYDKCLGFPYIMDTDLTVSMRRKMFNLNSKCSKDCQISTIDQHQYQTCICKELKQETLNWFEESTFNEATLNYFIIYRCFKTLVNTKFSSNLGFWAFFGLFILYGCCLSYHFINYSYTNNIPKIVLNDCITKNWEEVKDDINKDNFDNNLMQETKKRNSISDINELNNSNCHKKSENINEATNNSKVGNIQVKSCSEIEILESNNNIVTLRRENQDQDKTYKINNNIESSDKRCKTEETKKLIIETKSDLEFIPSNLLVEYDERNSLEFLWDDIVENIWIFNLTLVHSVVKPFFIRFIEFSLNIYFLIYFNSVFLTNDAIDKQTEAKLSGINTSLSWVFKNMYYYWVLPIFLSNIISYIITLIVVPSDKCRESLNDSLLTEESDLIIKEM